MIGFANLTSDFAKIGEFDDGKAPGCVPISALAHYPSEGGLDLRVFWCNQENEIVERKNNNGWGPIELVVEGLRPGCHLAATQWDNGKHIRVYFQTPGNDVLEMCYSGWFRGATVGKAC